MTCQDCGAEMISLPDRYADYGMAAYFCRPCGVLVQLHIKSTSRGVVEKAVKSQSGVERR